MQDVVKDVAGDTTPGPFEELLWEWASLNERTARVWKADRDVPWWYNERASVSLFAGAVWRAGGIAFEEFSSDKERPGKKGEIAAGRIDLRFSYDRETYGVEAKPCWPAVGRKAQSAEDTIARALQEATADVRRIPEVEGKKLAIVFASPSFPKSEFDDAKKRLKRWREIFDAVRSEGKAFVWIRDCKWIEDEGYLYPGAAIFISEVAG